MFTSKDIRKIEFDTERKGYNTEDVRAFLNQLADQLEKMESEKEEYEQSMLVLADKLEEYRKDEDKLSAALFNAQKIGDSMIEEARQKADIIINDANLKAGEIEQTIHAEEQAFQELKARSAKFREDLLALYRTHLELLSMVDIDEIAAGAADYASGAGYAPQEEYADDYGTSDEQPVYSYDKEYSETLPQQQAAAGGEMQEQGFTTVEIPALGSMERESFTGSFDVSGYDEPVADNGAGYYAPSDDAGAQQPDDFQDFFSGTEQEPQEEYYPDEQAGLSEMEQQPLFDDQAQQPQQEDTFVEEHASAHAERHSRRSRAAAKNGGEGLGFAESKNRDRNTSRFGKLDFGSDFSFDI